MVFRDRNLVITLSLIVLLTTSTTVAADRDPSFTGLGRVSVAVSISNRLRLAAGLDADSIKTRIAKQLRRSNISVLSSAEFKKEKGRPQLLVEISDIAMSPPAPNAPDFVLTVTAFFYQDVLLSRANVGTIAAITWSTFPIVGVYKLRSGSSIKDDILDDVDRHVRAFLDVHRASNR